MKPCSWWFCSLSRRHQPLMSGGTSTSSSLVGEIYPQQGPSRCRLGPRPRTHSNTCQCLVCIHSVLMCPLVYHIMMLGTSAVCRGSRAVVTSQPTHFVRGERREGKGSTTVSDMRAHGRATRTPQAHPTLSPSSKESLWRPPRRLLASDVTLGVSAKVPLFFVAMVALASAPEAATQVCPDILLLPRCL